jgi:hypothetical protein
VAQAAWLSHPSWDIQVGFEPFPVHWGVIGTAGLRERPYSATGEIGCSGVVGRPAGRCAFGVIRGSGGTAAVWIAIGGGAERHIRFDAGVPVFSDGSSNLTYERQGDMNLVRVGDERYEIPDAVLFGG